jgi:hypothetical protein
VICELIGDTVAGELQLLFSLEELRRAELASAHSDVHTVKREMGVFDVILLCFCSFSHTKLACSRR